MFLSNASNPITSTHPVVKHLPAVHGVRLVRLIIHAPRTPVMLPHACSCLQGSQSSCFEGPAPHLLSLVPVLKMLCMWPAPCSARLHVAATIASTSLRSALWGFRFKSDDQQMTMVTDHGIDEQYTSTVHGELQPRQTGCNHTPGWGEAPAKQTGGSSYFGLLLPVAQRQPQHPVR